MAGDADHLQPSSMAMPEPKKTIANRLEYNVWAYEVSDKVACFTE